VSVGLFDGFADRFDKELCSDLSYIGHELVAKEFDRIYTIKRLFEKQQVRVIDLGCGTGSIVVGTRIS
jgi:predicted TPR repeat methyltransferase